MGASSRTRRATLLAVLACCSTLFATHPADAQERHVVVVGDSIILGAQGPITSSFNQRGWGVTFDAAVSRSTAAGLDAIESHRGELTDSLVVSLGANDAGSPGPFRQRVQAIMDATATVPHVYWVTIREVRDYYAPANQIVRDVAAGRANVTVIDWHGATAGATDLTAGDGLHLNGVGAARMSQLVTDTVVSGGVPIVAVPPPTEPPVTVPAPTVAPEPPITAPATTARPSTTVAPVASRERPAIDRVERAASDGPIDGRRGTSRVGWIVALAVVLVIGGAGVATVKIAQRHSHQS